MIHSLIDSQQTPDFCPIWGEEHKADVDDLRSHLPYLWVDSRRAGGKYAIRLHVANDIQGYDKSVKARLTTMLINQRILGVERPEVTDETIRLAIQEEPLPVYERAKRLLRHIAQQTPMGQTYSIFNNSSSLAWSESTTENELEVLSRYLLDTRLVNINPGLTSDSGKVTVTVEGYQHLEEIALASDPTQAFVAMWFNSEMDVTYDSAICPAIEAAGYRPFIVNRAHFLDEITDKIIAELRRSYFVIADFSNSEESGMRGSVYFEAGFAHGLHKPVVYTCRRNSKLAFDTNHYPHIVWEETKMDEFREQLKDRIVAVVGQGPIPCAE